jgi:hypothetical protein
MSLQCSFFPRKNFSNLLVKRAFTCQPSDWINSNVFCEWFDHLIYSVNLVWDRQTGRSFSKRFKEHLHSFRTNNSNSYFAQHIFENNHKFGPIDKTMSIVQFHQKGRHMNTLEKYNIYMEEIHNNHLNDQHTVNYNKMSEVIYNNDIT